MPASLIELKDFLGSIAQSLPKVTWKRMFGCDAVFADGTIFGLIWKEGRIGLKLLNDSDFSKLRATSGQRTVESRANDDVTLGSCSQNLA